MNSQGNTDQQLIEYLETIPDVYIGATLPCATDERILAIVSGVIEGTPKERQNLFSVMTRQAGGILQLFGERMSMLSVRKQNPDLLACGLVAMALAKEPDERSMTMRLTLLYRSAQLLGLEADEFFKQATQCMELRSSSLGHITSFLKRTPRLKGIDGMGYREVAGPSGLVYVAGYFSSVPAGLLYENEPSIPDHLETIFSLVERGSGSTSRLESYYDIRSRIEVTPQLAGELLALLHNGSHDTRVVLSLGGLGVKEAIGVLKNQLTADTGDFLLGFKIDAALALWWLEQSPQALQFSLEAASQDPTLGVRGHVAINLRYFECCQAVKTLRDMLAGEGSFNVKYYAADSLLKLSDPAGTIELQELTTKLRSQDPQIQKELFSEIDNLIAQRPLMDCLD